MSVWKLNFTGADGSVSELPAKVHKHMSHAELKEFAAEHGYGCEEHKTCLANLFDHVSVLPAGDLSMIDVDCTPFKRALGKESGLFALDWDVFEERIQQGVLHGIVDANGELISTINVIPKLNNGLLALLGYDEDSDNIPQIYETGAGWTDPNHRGLGIYNKFREAVLAEEGVNGDKKLILSQAHGKGASHVNIRNGWSLVNPEEYPFSSSLLGWQRSEGYLDKRYQLASGMELRLPSEGLYTGRDYSFAETKNSQTGVVGMLALSKSFLKKHDFQKHHHIWTNNPKLLKETEATLQDRLCLSEGTATTEITPDVVAYASDRWLSAIKAKFVVQANGDSIEVPVNVNKVANDARKSLVSVSENNGSMA